MARQLQALGRALYGVRAPEFAARVGAPLGFGSTRAFSSAVEGPPATGAPRTRLRLCIQRSALTRSPRSPSDAAAPARADLRETVERRLSGARARRSVAPAKRSLTNVRACAFSRRFAPRRACRGAARWPCAGRARRAACTAKAVRGEALGDAQRAAAVAGLRGRQG